MSGFGIPRPEYFLHDWTWRKYFVILQSLPTGYLRELGVDCISINRGTVVSVTVERAVDYFRVKLKATIP